MYSFHLWSIGSITFNCFFTFVCKYSVSRSISTDCCVPYFMDDIYIIPNVTLFSPGFWLLEVFVEIVPKDLYDVDSVEVSESWLPWFPNTGVLVLTTNEEKNHQCKWFKFCTLPTKNFHVTSRFLNIKVLWSRCCLFFFKQSPFPTFLFHYYKRTITILKPIDYQKEGLWE